MIIEIGHYSLILSTILTACLAFFASVRPSYASLSKLARIESLTVIQTLFVLTAFLSLIYAYVTSDFSVINVALNSHTSKPMLYKIAGVWGNHEGSMLLWLVILCLFSCAFAIFQPCARELKTRILASQAWLALGFHFYILRTSDPFLRFDSTPLNGRGLNPLLQDPALAAHPPILYTGYVGLSLAFSFAIAGLWQKEINQSWAQILKPWSLTSWVFLTLGVALGSFWAYYELGWGGWWFWDPVENAALMPWLMSTALIHSLKGIEKDKGFKHAALFCAIASFGLSLIGTFLVRSGILTSVHSFAVDPARGQFLLILISVILGYALVLFVYKAPKIPSFSSFDPFTIQGTLLFNNLMVGLLAGTVLLGTLYPYLLEAITSEQIAVGAPYFNETFIPLSFPLIGVMGLVPFLAWQREGLYTLCERLQFTFIMTASTVLISWFLQEGGSVFPLMAIALSVWLLGGTLSGVYYRRKALSLSFIGMSAAHGGIGVMILGMVVDVFWKQEKIQTLGLKEHLEIAGYTLRLEKVEQIQGPNYQAERAIMNVFKGGKQITALAPEKRYYPLHQVITTETAIKTKGFSHLYTALGKFEGNQRWSVRLCWHPMVTLIWLGAIISALGGMIALVASLQKRRVKP